MPNPYLKISDDDLKHKLDSVRAMIRRERRDGRDTYDVERELCWLEREEEWRKLRLDKHREYVDQMRRDLDQLAREEAEAEAELYKFDNVVPDDF